MAELKNIRIAVSGLYDYAFEELPTLRVALPGQGAPDWVEKKHDLFPKELNDTIRHMRNNP